MSGMIRLSQKQSRRVNALIRRECCNYDNGNCLLLNDGETCVCPQTITYSLLCTWFRSSVLPLDKELLTELSSCSSRRRCAECGKVFLSASNNIKYCAVCRETVKRRQAAQRKRKQRKRRHAAEQKKAL